MSRTSRPRWRTTGRCARVSTPCGNSWGSPAPGSTAAPSQRRDGSSTRRPRGAGSPGSTPWSPSPAPPAAASPSCSTRSPEWPFRRRAYDGPPPPRPSRAAGATARPPSSTGSASRDGCADAPCRAPRWRPSCAGSSWWTCPTTTRRPSRTASRWTGCWPSWTRSSGSSTRRSTPTRSSMSAICGRWRATRRSCSSSSTRSTASPGSSRPGPRRSPTPPGRGRHRPGGVRRTRRHRALPVRAHRGRHPGTARGSGPVRGGSWSRRTANFSRCRRGRLETAARLRHGAAHRAQRGGAGRVRRAARGLGGRDRGGEAAERAWLRNANRACGTPWLRLWRWYNDRREPTTGRLPVRAQADEEATARQRVEQAVRTVADRASRGLPAPWAQAVREAAVRGSQGLPEALDELAARAGLPVGRPPRPGWWPAAVLAQASMTILQVVGGLWLLGQIIGFMTPNLGVPVLLMVAGIVGGPLVEWSCRLAARGPARRYGLDAERRLREAAAGCGRARCSTRWPRSCCGTGRCGSSTRGSRGRASGEARRVNGVGRRGSAERGGGTAR